MFAVSCESPTAAASARKVCHSELLEIGRVLQTSSIIPACSLGSGACRSRSDRTEHWELQLRAAQSCANMSGPADRNDNKNLPFAEVVTSRQQRRYCSPTYNYTHRSAYANCALLVGRPKAVITCAVDLQRGTQIYASILRPAAWSRQRQSDEKLPCFDNVVIPSARTVSKQLTEALANPQWSLVSMRN
jgi:hypothetical protein